MRAGPYLRPIAAISLAAFTLVAGIAAPATAQNLFSPAISVNDAVITNYEIDQRERFLRVLRTPGNLSELAREQLIEDRLKIEALTRAGLGISDQGLQDGMAEFAGRANLTLEQFTQALNAQGVAQETLRDFVRVGIGWREFIRQRFGPRVRITEAEIDQALGATGAQRSGIRVLLSEIILPARPGAEAASATATAERISQITSTSAFSAEASRRSVLPSRSRGGRLDWVPLNQLPPALQGLVLTLAPGEVTDPLPIPNAIALFQLRAIEETEAPAPEYAAIEYARFLIPGGRSAEALRTAGQIAQRSDTCDDLYGAAKGLPEEMLTIEALPPGQIPTDIALELSKLDAGETSAALTTPDGQALMLLMLCGRTSAAAADTDRDAIRNRLRGQRLSGYADALLAEMRADAVIREQ